MAKLERKAKPYMDYAPKANGDGEKDAVDWLAHVKEKEQKAISKYMPAFDQFLKDKALLVTRSSEFSSWEKVDAVSLKASSSDKVKVHQIALGEFTVSGPNERHEDYIITTAPTAKRINGIRIKVKADANNTKGGLSMAEDSHVNFTDIKMFVRTKSTGTQQFIEYKQARADHEFKKKGKSYKRLGKVSGILDDDPRTGWTSEHGDISKEYTIVVNFFNKVYELGDDKEVVIELHHRSIDGFRNMRRFSIELYFEFGNTSEKNWQIAK